jgi:SAM-dependent methyltransferase
VTEGSLRRAERRRRDAQIVNVHFEQRDLLGRNDDLRGFDFVYAQGTLHHVARPQLGVRRLLSALRPGGRGYFWFARDGSAAG